MCLATRPSPRRSSLEARRDKPASPRASCPVRRLVWGSFSGSSAVDVGSRSTCVSRATGVTDTVGRDVACLPAEPPSERLGDAIEAVRGGVPITVSGCAVTELKR